VLPIPVIPLTAVPAPGTKDDIAEVKSIPIAANLAISVPDKPSEIFLYPASFYS
jgi:hypothetical protein